MRKAAVFLALILLSINFAIMGCSGDQDKTGSDKDDVVVYATIYPVYDFAAHVCGDRARVVQLVPDGVEPHDWEPSPKDMVNLQQADVIVYNGAGMETWVQKVLQSLKEGGPVAVDCSTGIELLPVAMQPGTDSHGHDESADGHLHDTHTDGAHEVSDGHVHAGNTDPHIWLDPQNAGMMVENIVKGMQKADPDNAGYYNDNAVRYQKQLSGLDKKFAETLDGVAVRKFIVSHAAFGYLAHRYNLEQVPIRGISPSADPSPARMTEIVETARQTGVKYIFFETLVSPRVSEVIAREAGAQTLVLNPLGGITPEERQAGKDYLSVMEENLRHLSLALGVKQK
ncbi:metal ABC transporter substrate-binding protein [Desulfoscipio sp. XC116]|uniref:metal ABC transporter substrate-binding protein n=1 Tax=Desulfoscipio sp. XC116 TaxID=3144975 RepID=UPI00325BFAD4